ncbi:MAG: hypothetical protein LBH76_10555, partial [Propionibacteriaceae bacterium]|nr:hypothetical protein [Propionibacteriaceae bacterium]
CSATDLVPFDEVVVSGFEPGPKPGLSDWYSPVLSLRRHGGAVVGRAVGPDGPALLAFSATDFTAAASSPGDRRPGHSPRRP